MMSGARRGTSRGSAMIRLRPSDWHRQLREALLASGQLTSSDTQRMPR